MVETRIRRVALLFLESWSIISRNKLAAINRNSRNNSQRSLTWYLFTSPGLRKCPYNSKSRLSLWNMRNIIFTIKGTRPIFYHPSRILFERIEHFWGDELGGLSLACTRYTDWARIHWLPIQFRVVWTETRWQIDSSSVERLAEMQLKGYRLSRNKRDTNRIEAVIDRSSNSHDFRDVEFFHKAHIFHNVWINTLYRVFNSLEIANNHRLKTNRE